VQLQKLLKPFGLVHFYTDGAGVYKRHLPASAHTVGKAHTQQSERKHLTLRTRDQATGAQNTLFLQIRFHA
jgi:IS1 family transposase